jgi:hypothetical protein
MTEITIRTRASLVARISRWVRGRQRDLSTRVHAAGDERSRQYGWEVVESTGRFGFGARSYRDPRFNDRRRQHSPAGALRGQPWVHPGDIRKDHPAAAAGGASGE